MCVVGRVHACACFCPLCSWLLLKDSFVPYMRLKPNQVGMVILYDKGFQRRAPRRSESIKRSPVWTSAGRHLFLSYLHFAVKAEPHNADCTPTEITCVVCSLSLYIYLKCHTDSCGGKVCCVHQVPGPQQIKQKRNKHFISVITHWTSYLR